jgi:hypothetical protein
LDIASTKSLMELHDLRPSTTEKILADQKPNNFNQQMNNTISEYLRVLQNNVDNEKKD